MSEQDDSRPDLREPPCSEACPPARNPVATCGTPCREQDRHSFGPVVVTVREHAGWAARPGAHGRA
ncbi:hypothetical protein ACFPM0_00685 [Pseudonocardia sulfidoxydans]|uniref:hypothetical protein n=1 Tax=Pseudonocardia sulfidoxydans TaxID=54011 RepID=UPI0036150E88